MFNSKNKDQEKIDWDNLDYDTLYDLYAKTLVRGMELLVENNDLKQELNSTFGNIYKSQKSAMYQMRKDIQNLSNQIEESQSYKAKIGSWFQKLLKHHNVINGKDERSAKIYLKLMRHGVGVEEMLEIARNRGYEGLREKRLEYINNKRSEDNKPPLDLKKNKK